MLTVVQVSATRSVAWKRRVASPRSCCPHESLISVPTSSNHRLLCPSFDWSELCGEASRYLLSSSWPLISKVNEGLQVLSLFLFLQHRRHSQHFEHFDSTHSSGYAAGAEKSLEARFCSCDRALRLPGTRACLALHAIFILEIAYHCAL